MIVVPDSIRSILGRSCTRYLRVESWLGDQLLADDVPAFGGGEEVDASLTVPERVTLTVPRRDRGMSWSPTVDDHPLAAHGQRLRVQLGVGGPSGVEWIQRGWYLVQSARPDGDEVRVEAVGLLTLVEEADLISPYQPSGSLTGTLRGLVEPALTVDLGGAPTDRAVPAGLNWDSDRLAAVYELLDAWPAEARVTENGYLAVTTPAAVGTPVLDLTNGAGGTVIQATGETTRDGCFNAVVARGTAPDGGQIQGVAYDHVGPRRYGGPFNPLPVPYYYFSPLLATAAQCAAAAATILARLRRQAGRVLEVEMVPDPTIQDGDVVTVTTEDLDHVPAVVERLNLPYTADGGSQRLIVREVR